MCECPSCKVARKLRELAEGFDAACGGGDVIVLLLFARPSPLGGMQMGAYANDHTNAEIMAREFLTRSDGDTIVEGEDAVATAKHAIAMTGKKGDA